MTSEQLFANNFQQGNTTVIPNQPIPNAPQPTMNTAMPAQPNIAQATPVQTSIPIQTPTAMPAQPNINTAMPAQPNVAPNISAQPNTMPIQTPPTTPQLNNEEISSVQEPKRLDWCTLNDVDKLIKNALSEIFGTNIIIPSLTDKTTKSDIKEFMLKLPNTINADVWHKLETELSKNKELFKEAKEYVTNKIRERKNTDTRYANGQSDVIIDLYKEFYVLTDVTQTAPQPNVPQATPVQASIPVQTPVAPQPSVPQTTPVQASIPVQTPVVPQPSVPQATPVQASIPVQAPVAPQPNVPQATPVQASIPVQTPVTAPQPSVPQATPTTPNGLFNNSELF